jgi:hypothetical protein
MALNPLVAPLFLTHPSSVPHSDALGVPIWAQWVVVGLVGALGIWLIVDARSDRARSVPDAPPPDADRPPAPAHPADEPLPSNRLVRADVVVRPVVRPSGVTTEASGGANPLGVLVLLFGFVAGWVVLDRVREVEALASFLRTDGAAQVARLGFAFAALLWVGGALAVVAPRGAILPFAVAGAIGVFLATASEWESRLEWWGASAVLQGWDRLWLWAGFAFALAILSFAAGRYRPRRALRLPGRRPRPADV